jgi:L-iditol 2-dehydrogenase
LKAAILYGNEDIRYGDWPEPEATPGKVKIAVKSSGICGSDIPRVLSGGAHYYPIVLGHEFSGIVAEVGEGVTCVKPGDTVTCAPRVPCLACSECLSGRPAQCANDSFIGTREPGGFAEFIAVREANVVKYDPSVPFDTAVFFEPATVALHGFFNIGYEGGGYTAIVGAGTIGLFAAQWARAFGARNVVCFDVDDERLSQARALGADAAINSGQDGFLEKALDLTDGRGFRWVFDAAGMEATMKASFALADAQASVCLIGTPPTGVSFSKREWETINRKELWVRGCWQSYSIPFPGREWELTADYFSSGRLTVGDRMVFRRYPLEKASEAFALYREPGRVHGKVLLVNE